ncbi:MAG: phosphate/phosphite/phosphonate ABC transporter substrate-binding protein [Acidobacteriota bacterium]
MALWGCAAPSSDPDAIDAATAPETLGSDTLTLTLGKISDEPRGKIRDWQPLADYLTENLDGVSFDVKIAPDDLTMATWLQTGEVDLFFDNPFATAYVQSRSPTHFLVSRIKTGPAEKKGIFVTASDNGVTSLDDLVGRVIGLEEPESASGYYLPIAHLRDRGYRLVEVVRNALPGTDEIGYVFTFDDDNTIVEVLTGRLLAGVIDSRDFEAFRQANPDQLIEIATTAPITRNQPGLVGPAVNEELGERIRELLVELDGSDVNPAGQPILPRKTARFAPVSDQDKKIVEHLSRWLDQNDS